MAVNMLSQCFLLHTQLNTLHNKIGPMKTKHWQIMKIYAVLSGGFLNLPFQMSALVYLWYNRTLKAIIISCTYRELFIVFPFLETESGKTQTIQTSLPVKEAPVLNFLSVIKGLHANTMQIQSYG